MQIKALFWGLAVCAVFSSCSVSSETGRGNFERIVSLTGENWNIPDSLSRVGAMFLLEDFLVMSDDNGETLYSLINTENHSRIYRFGIRGQGPEEVLTPIQPTIQGKNIDLFDHNRGELLRFSVEDILRGDKGVSEVVFKTRSVPTFRCVEFPEGNMLVNFGWFNGGRFCLLDYDGNILSYTGTYPLEDESSDLPFWVLFSAYQGQMLRQPQGNRFVISTYNAEILEIYECDFTAKTIDQVFIRCKDYPYIKTVSRNGVPNYVEDEHTKYGYSDIYVTDRYIYALYSGQYHGSKDDTSGNLVQVFDWDGNAVECLELDCKAKGITGNDQVLYAHVKTSDEGDDIREYKLNIK